MKKQNKVAFISSGSGSLTKVILDALHFGVIPNLIPICIISDRESPSLNLANQYQIKAHKLPFENYNSREVFSTAILDVLKKEKVDFAFMTFNRLLEGPLLKEYQYRIINHHPALLPAFPGFSSVKKIKKSGSTFLGATCHFIDNGIDTGAIINQCVMPLNKNESESVLSHKLFQLRSRLAVEAVYALANDLLKINNNEVTIKGANYESYPINPSLEIQQIDEFFKSYGQ